MEQICLGSSRRHEVHEKLRMNVARGFGAGGRPRVSRYRPKTRSAVFVERAPILAMTRLTRPTRFEPSRFNEHLT
jgi:hypothetical protein